MTNATSMVLKVHGTWRCSGSVSTVPQVGHAPCSSSWSSSTRRSHSSHQAIATSASPDADSQFDRRRPEIETLPELVLDVAEVVGRNPGRGEQGERRRIGRSLDAVADASPGSRVPGLDVAQGSVERPGGDAGAVG